MITIISGTNRPNSNTELFASLYALTLSNKQVANKFLKLTDIPISIIHPSMYAERISAMKAIQENYMIPAEKFIFVAPEYNGSIPGFLKLFIDACEPKPCFKGKKAALVGVATGRAGNLRGMDHLTGILNHMGCEVFPNKIPFSSINNLKNEEGKLNLDVINLVDQQVAGFLDF